ncbi:deoxyribodipyrimidine photo-lyase [Proteobacteria bacterium 005FR1]|nr:deoxyribodipyrimidine photo-lyase [Proteobacteria bacterium 005FR1]
MSDVPHSLVWFRNDLRVADNPALYHACRSSDKVSAVFFFTPQQWQQHHLSPRRIQFTRNAVLSLQRQLAGAGVKLHVRTAPWFADVPGQLLALCRQEKINQLCFNREYALDESRRDQGVLSACEDAGIRTFTAHGSVIVPPGAVLSKQGEPYRVFTPFKRAWLQALERYERQLYSAPKKAARSLPEETLDSLPDDLPAADVAAYPATEAEAHRRLQRFSELHLAAYDRDRNIPAVNGTSQLSAYLNIGLISPRACLQAIRMVNEGELTSGNPGAQSWVGELIWREFYLHILAAFPDISRRHPFQPKTEQVPWRHNDEDFRRWAHGRTGFPLVDAAMQQLNTTGWMHNRLRMVTATFLTKYLLIDWRRGEDYFMEQLIDGNFAANNGGWQWSASTGTDAAPYFRILNPVRQGERFDPRAEFIKAQLPQLQDLPARIIHQPGHPDLLAAGYPAPMVELKDSKERCLAAFKFALAS